MVLRLVGPTGVGSRPASRRRARGAPGGIVPHAASGLAAGTEVGAPPAHDDALDRRAAAAAGLPRALVDVEHLLEAPRRALGIDEAVDRRPRLSDAQLERLDERVA